MVRSNIMRKKTSSIKVKYILSHPIQYFVPLIQKLALCDDIDLHVVYATDAGARDYFDHGFSRKIYWDRPLLEGYNYTILNPGKALGKGFWEVRADGVKEFLKREKTDIAIIHGWGTHLNAVATLAAFANNIPILYRTEIQRYNKGKLFLGKIKPFVLFPLLRRIDGFLAIGSLNRDYYIKAGVKPDRIFWAPYSIDTSLFLGKNITEQDRLEEEKKIGLQSASFRVIFCGKLFEIKRPFDIIEAASIMPSKEKVEIIFIGDGKLLPDLKRLAQERNVKAHFLGFRNQKELPLLYSLGDVLVLPSEHEPWGLVVNEAMTMGIPAIVSSSTGCGPDLVINDKSGYICPVGDISSISRALERMASSKNLHSHLRQGALERISGFSIDHTLEGYILAIHSISK
jgi:glycosyltransferase involved in cell wall biosynthesis